MEQRQLRLGDTLDDYCPRERRLTNHSVVAMVGADVKPTRCTTCDTEHEYKHAKVPRQRRKSDTPAALYAQVAATAPKRATVSRDAAISRGGTEESEDAAEAFSAADESRFDQPEQASIVETQAAAEDEFAAGGADEAGGQADDGVDDRDDRDDEQGPVHRQLIRASLPREGQPPVARPIPEFTIRQPLGGRPSRFRPHQQHARGQEFQGNRSNGNGPGPGAPRGGGPRPGGRPPQAGMPSRLARRHGPGRKRSK